ncbi:MAG: hypothetical protein FJZ15_03855 [Candidatus Omnitrophica bacterium]|nr:hypothetical protein [Candidatus Omnitrophota bacterium]
MFKKFVVIAVMAAVVLPYAALFAAESDFPQDKVIAIATAAVKDKGIELAEVNIIYDEGGQLWSRRLGEAVVEDQSPNHGILKQGFLKNYRIVYFDFKEPLKDIWVFVDKDSGEVLTVQQE